MTIFIPISDLPERLTELIHFAEQGETVTVTSEGKPLFDLTPHRAKGGLSLEAGAKFLRDRGVTQIFPYVAADFDDPLPEDFLLRPLP